jgi:hypothetical protein
MAKRKKLGFSTQDYVKLGHELRDMLGRAHEYACTLPNGTSGYLLPENETMALWAYVSWAVQHGPQLRGGRKRSAEEKLFEAIAYNHEVIREQKRTGSSRTAAIKAVADNHKKPDAPLPSGVTKKNFPYIRNWIQSAAALEKLIAPARLEALKAACVEERERPRRETTAHVEEGKRLGRERGWFPETE